ncbi:unnamed protein product [Adineta steineri]|uniref:Uncharacterized protein n=1 Tax=Adineta steineri TaxID=433720 RepID=A0A814A6B8_9BILA|nr:unnamed protein product [Adineta steineri]CAF4076180.1 unnamed protein product [Adineta steineri]
MTQPWNESLFGCFDDCGSCCYGCCCTPCLFGQNAEKIDGSNCCLCCLGYSILSSFYMCWLPHYMKRQALRENYNLVEEPSCGDLPTTICCSPCALCQEARFLERQAQTGGNFTRGAQTGGNFTRGAQTGGNFTRGAQTGGNFTRGAQTHQPR